MVYITEMIPNIWWGYTKMNSTNEIDKMYLNKFTNHHKIGDVIKIDEYVSFWNKSTQFIFDIKKQLEQKENQDMLIFVKKVCKLIDNNYKNSKSTLIFTNKTIKNKLIRNTENEFCRDPKPIRKTVFL